MTEIRAETSSEIPISFTLEYPYTRTLGPVIGPFLTALRDGRILGIRCGERVLCPPLEFDPETGAELAPDFVEVGPAGTIENWTFITEPSRKHPFDESFAFAQIRLDGADTTLTHAVRAESESKLATGLRVRAQFRAQRIGAITDLYFVPETEAREQAIEAGEKPVEISTHRISLTYHDTLYPHVARYARGLLEGQFIGQRMSDGRIAIPGKGYDALARTRLTAADDVEIAPTGTVLSYTVITPVQYRGQEETEPYLCATIILDGADQSLAQQEIRNIALDQFRVGMRLRAIFKPPAERSVDAIDNDWMVPSTGDVLARWEPTGEPDVPPGELPEKL